MTFRRIGVDGGEPGAADLPGEESKEEPVPFLGEAVRSSIFAWYEKMEGDAAMPFDVEPEGGEFSSGMLGCKSEVVCRSLPDGELCRCTRTVAEAMIDTLLITR